MTRTKTKQKPVFTRVTLDEISLNAVKQIQQAIPNYGINDAVKMIIGIGIKNLDLDSQHGRLPDKNEQKALDNFVKNPDLAGVDESEKFLEDLKNSLV